MTANNYNYANNASNKAWCLLIQQIIWCAGALREKTAFENMASNWSIELGTCLRNHVVLRPQAPRVEKGLAQDDT